VWKLEESYDVGAALWEGEKPSMQMWNMDALEPCTCMQKDPFDAEDLAVSHERDLLHTTAQQPSSAELLQMVRSFGPVRTVLTKKERRGRVRNGSASNGDCHVELLTRKPCLGRKHNEGSDLVVPQY
jgi:hypothetical protein